MTKPLILQEYQQLITSLPVKEQAFQVKASIWRKHLPLEEVEELFKNEEVILISRQDVFATKKLRTLILKTLLWGYPRGMRGKNFANIYSKIDELVRIFEAFPNRKLQTSEWQELQNALQTFTGLGLSTYSKLVYFLNYEVEGMLALILDERLIRVFKNNVFKEFSALSTINTFNKERLYIDYLHMMKEEAKKLNVQPENLEQFLFIFGNGLKRD